MIDIGMKLAQLAKLGAELHSYLIDQILPSDDGGEWGRGDSGGMEKGNDGR